METSHRGRGIGRPEALRRLKSAPLIVRRGVLEGLVVCVRNNAGYGDVRWGGNRDDKPPFQAAGPDEIVSAGRIARPTSASIIVILSDALH
jgi:hypothetical protein